MKGDLIWDKESGHAIMDACGLRWNVLVVDIPQLTVVTVSRSVVAGRKTRSNRIEVWTRRSVVDRFELRVSAQKVQIDKALYWMRMEEQGRKKK